MEQTLEQDAWAVADSAKPRDFEVYGQVKAEVWFGFFPGNGQKPIPFDAAQHPADKKAVMIDVQIIPVPEQNITFAVRQNYTDFSPDWTRITLPSIKKLGVDGLRALNGRWVRMAQVDGRREKRDANGDKTGEFYKTFKFVEVYADEATCRTAYAGAAPTHTEQQPADELPDPAAPAPTANPEKETALKFARVVIENCARQANGNLTDALTKTRTTLATMPMISKFFTGDSPEIMTMLMEAMQ